MCFLHDSASPCRVVLAAASCDHLTQCRIRIKAVSRSALGYAHSGASKRRHRPRPSIQRRVPSERAEKREGKERKVSPNVSECVHLNRDFSFLRSSFLRGLLAWFLTSSPRALEGGGGGGGRIQSKARARADEGPSPPLCVCGSFCAEVGENGRRRRPSCGRLLPLTLSCSPSRRSGQERSSALSPEGAVDRACCRSSDATTFQPFPSLWITGGFCGIRLGTRA